MVQDGTPEEVAGFYRGVIGEGEVDAWSEVALEVDLDERPDFGLEVEDVEVAEDLAGE